MNKKWKWLTHQTWVGWVALALEFKSEVQTIVRRVP